MKVALAYPSSKASHHHCNPPVALLGLATNLRAHGIEAAVFDRDGCAGGMDELIHRIASFGAEVCGIPMFSVGASFLDVRALLQGLRQRLRRAIFVLGGPHVSAMPGETLRWYPEADFLLQGEADHTLLALLKQFSGNAARPTVPGLCWRSNGDYESVPVGNGPADLDALPIPDRRLLWENYRRGVYWRIDCKGPVDYIVTGRGCPFDCNFCFKLERGYRPRSPENVVSELAYLASLGITAVDIEDDLFTVSKARCLRICSMIREAGLKLDLKVRSRVDTIDRETLEMLRRAGVRTVVFGFESGSQAILDAMNKRVRVEENYRAVRMTKKARLACYGDLFIGFPGETPQTLGETRRFLRTARPTAINVGILDPLPRTRVYVEAKANGTLVGDWSVGGPAPFVRLPWIETRADLWAANRRLVRSFYFNPLVMVRILQHVLPRLNRRMCVTGFRFIRRVARV